MHARMWKLNGGDNMEFKNRRSLIEKSTTVRMIHQCYYTDAIPCYRQAVYALDGGRVSKE